MVSSEEDPDPFVVPTEEALFQTIIDAKTRSKTDQAQLRVTRSSQRIYEKSTFASRMQASFAKRESLPSLEEPDLVAAAGEAQADGIATLRSRPTETVADFLSKKREIFLVQMNLDTRRAEICKLEQRALQRENALKKSEEMLEEDAIRFDAFLKENDEKVQQALKNAETEAKKKQDKIAEIKRLQVEISAARSEVNKYEEQLEDFRLYKKFLDDVTPREWFEEQQAKRERLKEEKLRQWRMQCDAVKKRKLDAAEAKTRAEATYNNARTQQEAEAAEKTLRETIDQLKATKLLKEPPKPSLEDALDSQENEESYFQRPMQLLELFTNLEEQNIFLIQNLQESEEGLDRSRSQLQVTQVEVDREADSLNKQIAALEALAGTKRRHYRRDAAQRSTDIPTFAYSDIPTETPVSLDELAAKVRPSTASSLPEGLLQLTEVYGGCGFAGDRSIGPLTMLEHLESKLEELLTTADRLPKEFVDSFERSREKERRQKSRAAKQELQKREHEARVQRALERAEAPVFKKTGKPEMFRSLLPKKTQRRCQQEESQGDEELAQFLALEF